MSRRKVLIKYGGNAMINENLKEQIANQIKALQQHDVQVVLVHGGGPFINKALDEAGIASEFFEGQRKTTKEALSVIERTLKGEVNSSLVNIFNRAGLQAVGLSGKDGPIALAEKKQQESKNGSPTDLGQVGEVKSVNTKLLDLLLDGGFLPVITCLGSDEEGIDYNINGDVFAGKIAAALEVDDYVVLTDVDGLYQNYPDPASIIHQLSLSQLPSYYGTVITGGMIPKIQSCEDAVASGVKRAVILNGTKPGQISDYILENTKIGTSLSK
jgi:acetylglutamate kinase